MVLIMKIDVKLFKNIFFKCSMSKEKDTGLIIKKDLENVLYLSKKYHLHVSSWYWRLQETEDEWINRLVKLSMERKEVRGCLLGEKISLTYIIPLESTEEEVTIKKTENMQTQEFKTSYALLYETLERYL